MRKVFVFFQVFVGCFLMTSALWADSLSLKNGDTVRGTIISINREQVKYVPSLTGTELAVPWADVKSLKSDEAFDLELLGGERVSGTLDYTARYGFRVKSSRLGKTKVQMADMLQAMPQSALASSEGGSYAPSETQVASTEEDYSGSNIQTFGQESDEDSPPITFLRGSTVLFGGFSATYTWPAYDDYDNEYTYGNNGWSYDYHFGFGMAVNDRLSFSARLMGAYRPALRWNNDSEGRFSTDPMWATFAFAYRLSPTMVLEPNLMFGLNEEAGDPRITVGISKKFN